MSEHANNRNPTIEGLRELDSRAVPLPNGTEVASLRDVVVQGRDRPLPQGAVGRVLDSDGEVVRVLVVGVGEVDFERRDLAPRRRGQLRFAARRAEDEALLEPCVVLDAVVGSRAWGLAHEGSDIDRRRVFLLPFPWTTGLASPTDAFVSRDGSTTTWEIEKAIRQALRADPNTLEMLFVPDVEAADEVGAELLAARDAFVSARIHGSFGRYALSQGRRLANAARLVTHREALFDWLGRHPHSSLDEAAARLARGALAPDADDLVGRVGRAADDVARARQHVKQLYQSLHDQGWLPERSFEALRDFVREGGEPPPTPRSLRPKNAANLLRLVAVAVHWLSTGEALIETRGALRDRLLAIQGGEVDLAMALRWVEEEAAGLEAARERTPLPHEPDLPRADAVLRLARERAACRWHRREPGPWGADAPQPPPLQREPGTAARTEPET